MLPLLAFIGGVVLISQIYLIISLHWIVLGLLVLSGNGGVAYCLGIVYRQPRWCVGGRQLACMMLASLLGVMIWQLAYHRATRWQLSPSRQAPLNITLHGVILGLPAVKAHSTEAIVAVSMKQINKALGQEQSASRGNVHLMLQWYQLASPLMPGQHWRLQLRLRPLHGFQNPGSFDYVDWLLQQNIQAVGQVVQATPLSLNHDMPLGIRIDSLRAGLRRAQRTAMPASPLLGVLTALCLGDKSLISPQVQQVFIRTGTAHLLAISGLHIGLIAGMVCLLGRYLWRLWPSLCLWIPARTAGLYLGVLAAWGYALLAGLAVSTQRAALMVSIAAMALGCRRRFAWLSVWVLTLACVLMISPLSVTSSGLWLSFVAVLGLSYLGLHPRTRGFPGYAWLRLQVCLTLLLAPLMLALFHQVALTAIPANLVAIPWIGTVIVPIVLVGTLLQTAWFWGGHMLLVCALKLLTWFWPILTYLADMPDVTWAGGVSTITALLLGLWATAWLLAPYGVPWRQLGFGLLLPAWLNPGVMPAERGVSLTVLDVGQGLAVVIRTHQHTLIYDTGPGDPQGFNAGSAVLVPYLRNSGVRRIDRVVLSHGDNDHIAGLLALSQSYGHIPILTSDPTRIRQTLHLDGSLGVSQCLAGMHWRWDNVDFAILYPDKQHLGLDNNSSCVLQVRAAGRTLLLTGDIEAPAEQWLINQPGVSLNSDVLVVPHHGSAGAALPRFLMTIAPKYAIFATGYMNRFHFPRLHVLESYQTMDSQVLNTANDGAVNVDISPQGRLAVSTYLRTT